MRILIADDHPLFRDALRAILLRAYPQAQLLEVGDIGALYAQANAELESDLLLLDLNMPGAHGFSALIHLRACYPTLRCRAHWFFNQCHIRFSRPLRQAGMGFSGKQCRD